MRVGTNDLERRCCFRENHTSESASFMTHDRPMLPRDGRIAVTPHVADGLIRLPSVSVPIENGTVAAATLAAGPGATRQVRTAAKY